MTLAEFRRATPRLIMLIYEGYLQRRGFAAFHAGYGIHVKDARIENLPGMRKASRPAMSPDQMRTNMRSIMVAHNTALKAANEGS